AADVRGVTPEDLAAAEVRRVHTDARLVEARADLTRLTERLDGRRRAAGGLDVDAARAQVEKLRGLVGEAEDATGRLVALQAELDAFDGETQALRDRVAGLAESLAGRDAALRTGRTEV